MQRRKHPGDRRLANALRSLCVSHKALGRQPFILPLISPADLQKANPGAPDCRVDEAIVSQTSNPSVKEIA
jgi:hypothetical protein